MVDTHCEPCKARGKQNKSSFWCVNCEEPMCSDCTEHHRVMKVSKNHQIIEISRVPKQINISDQCCAKHDNLPYEYFCVDHDVLGCKECLAAIHRACKNVMSVDIASKGAKRSQAFIDCVELIQQLLNTLGALTNDRQKLIDDIEQEVNKIKASIRTTKEKLISYVESLERTLLQELNQRKHSKVSDLQQQVNEFQNMEKKVKEENEIVELVQNQGTDKQAFLLTLSKRNILKEFERNLISCTDKAVNHHFNFEEINAKNTIKSIGSLEVTETPCQIKFVPLKKRQSQVPVDSSSKLPSLVYECDINMSNVTVRFIRGITLNERNELILCEGANTRLLVYDENNTYKNQIKTKYEPWDIAVIPGTATVVVTSYGEYYIQFIDIERKKTVKEMKVENSGKGGIAVSTEYIFVGAKEKIHVLDHQGRSVRIINLQDTDRNPWFMCLGKNGNIYYTTLKCIVCIQPDGKVVFTSSNVTHPWGIQTDNHDNVYVIDNDKSAIHRFRFDGTVIDVLKNDVLSGPISLYFNRDYTKLYVTNRCGHSVSCFKLAQV